MKAKSGSFIDQQVALVEHHLPRWLATAAHLWEKACAFEGISSPALVQSVAFSPTNPWVPFYNYALVQYQQTHQEVLTGGYVSLIIHQGKARISK